MIGAVVSGISGLAQSFINREGQRRADERYNRNAIELQNLANQQNIDFWNMQNQYNHPSQAMQRLKEAGLNPAMMYGKGGAMTAGTAGNIAPSKAAPQRQSNLTPQILSSMAQFADIRLREAQTQNVQQETDKKNEETKLLALKRIEQGYANLAAQHAPEAARLENAWKKAKTSHEWWKEDVTSSQAQILRRQDFAQDKLMEDEPEMWIKAEKAKLQYFINNTNNVELKNHYQGLLNEYYFLENIIYKGAQAGSQVINSVTGGLGNIVRSFFKKGTSKSSFKYGRDGNLINSTETFSK